MIDVHTHYVPRGMSTPVDGPWVRDGSTIMLGEREFRPIGRQCWDVETRLADMDADGVSAQVVSPTPVFFSPDVELARRANDEALALCAHAPERLLPMCQVPLPDADAACAELSRCMESGHVGVEIGNHIGDRDLDDAGVVTFLQHAASVGAAVFVHPWDMATSPRLDRWMARWLAGMPAETHLSIVAMILGGVFDAVPSSLRICFAHGGGSFPFWLGRFENAWHRKADLVRGSEQPPSAYLDRLYVDSVVFDEPALRLLVDTMGVSQVMVGSDYPYPLGERPAGAVVRRASFLDEAGRSAIMDGNPRRFLSR